MRIFPVYFSYLAVLAGLSALGLYQEALSSWLGCLTFTRNVVGRGDSATTHFWSLAVEEQFYLVWPAILVATFAARGKAGAATSCVAVAALAVAVRALAAQHGGLEFDRIVGMYSIFRYADSLAVGCLAAFARPSSWFRDARLAAVAAVVLALAKLGEGTAAAFLVPAVQAVAFASVMLFTVEVRKGVLFRVLNSRVLAGLGLISYSLYVWHVLFLSKLIGPALGESWVFDWKWWLLPSLALAGGSYLFIEKPFVSWRARLRRHA